MLSLVAIETGGDVTVVADVRGFIPESASPERRIDWGAVNAIMTVLRTAADWLR